MSSTVRRVNPYLIEVHVHTLQLEVGGTVVDTIAVESVLAWDRVSQYTARFITRAVIDNTLEYGMIAATYQR